MWNNFTLLFTSSRAAHCMQSDSGIIHKKNSIIRIPICSMLLCAWERERVIDQTLWLSLSESVYPVPWSPTTRTQKIYEYAILLFSPTSQCLSNVKITLGPISRKTSHGHNSHWESVATHRGLWRPMLPFLRLPYSRLNDFLTKTFSCCCCF